MRLMHVWCGLKVTVAGADSNFLSLNLSSNFYKKDPVVSLDCGNMSKPI